MRTTIDLDASVLNQLRQRGRQTGKSMGQVASELLARALDEADRSEPQGQVSWISKDLGLPLIDLEDKETLRAILESGR